MSARALPGLRLLRRLFADLPTAAVSLLVIGLAAAALPGFLEWAVFDATFSGPPEACDAEGACWIFIGARLDQFLYGFYPAGERWRVDLAFGLLALALVPLFLPRVRWKLPLGVAIVVLAPLVGALLFSGGLLGLAPVPTNLWGGLFVTLLLPLAAMAVSLPAGVLLAVARTSRHPVARPLAAAVVAFPIAYYAARYARGKWRVLFYLGAMLPLWSSYLVKVYAWKLILAKEGILTWIFTKLHLTWLLEAWLAIPIIGGYSLSVSYTGTFLVFLYVWLPFMVLPVQAALERVPGSFIEASGDLGATPGQTFRHVIFPLALPGIVAGSIFTFSLTLGDYIIPQIVGSSRLFIGQAVYAQQGTAGNIPLAAAFTVVPIVIMGFYLWGAKRMGAFDAL